MGTYSVVVLALTLNEIFDNGALLLDHPSYDRNEQDIPRVNMHCTA